MRARSRPVVNFYSRCNNVILRALRVRARDELDITVSTVELSEMIAESVSEGLLDREEHTRLTRALQIRNRMVADVAVPVAEIHAVPVAAAGSGPTVGVIEKALAATGYSRFPVVDADGSFIGYLHIKDVLSLVDDPAGRRSTWPGSGRCPACSESLTRPRGPVADAPHQQPPGAGHRPTAAPWSPWSRWRIWSRPGRRRARRDATVPEARYADELPGMARTESY